MHGGGGKRIIFKKEHNLTFLSTTHSTPPPHSLVSPACSSSSLFFPSLSFAVAQSTTLSHTFPSLCLQLGHGSAATLRIAAVQATAELRGHVANWLPSQNSQRGRDQTHNRLLETPSKPECWRKLKSIPVLS